MRKEIKRIIILLFISKLLSSCVLNKREGNCFETQIKFDNENLLVSLDTLNVSLKNMVFNQDTLLVSIKCQHKSYVKQVHSSVILKNGVKELEKRFPRKHFIIQEKENKHQLFDGIHITRGKFENDSLRTLIICPLLH